MRVRVRFLAAWTLLALVAVSLLGSGCNAPTVWDYELGSPDGQYVAIARTVQSGGFGDNWIITSVSLQQTNIPSTNTEILSFFCDGPVPHPFVLDNAANAGGTINLQLKWITPSYLSVAYHGDASLDFQAVKYQGIHISLQEL
jgi:hypothetical protein